MAGPIRYTVRSAVVERPGIKTVGSSVLVVVDIMTFLRYEGRVFSKLMVPRKE